MSASAGILERVGPGAWSGLSARRVAHGVEHNALVFRRTWRGYVFVSLASPILYLAAMGVGLGSYVNRGATSELGGLSYLVFLAPGLLAAQAMMTAASEASYPIMGKIVWQKTYYAALNTPLTVIDLLASEICWIALRLAMVCAFFLAIMALVGAVESPLAVLALPVAVLTGLAFATPILAISATIRRDSSFNALFRFGITPLFLFSGTFFPISSLPGVVQPLAWLTPLWHGVELARALSVGRVEALPALVHLAVLTVFAVGGAVLAAAAYRRRLEL